MNTPVNFPIAKLLKENGFDEKSRSYNEDGKLITVSLIIRRFNPEKIYYPAPNIAEVVMWLYEKHNIWIEVRRHTKSGLRCFSPYIDNNPVNEDVFFNDYDSPTEAYEATIKHCLNNLITKSKNLWWGYKHINGSLNVKRYFDKQDIQEAEESDFCEKIIHPFEASSRKEALEYVEKLNSKQ